MRFPFIALLSLLVLTACDSTQALRDLKQVQPSSDPFLAALAEEYRTFAGEKELAYDWWTSKYFADKGLLAAYDHPIGPEDPAHWGLTEPEFSEARERLVAAIAANRTSRPDITATAMVDYDRWVELANNGWDKPRIAGAKEMFMVTLEELESPIAQHEGAPAMAKEKPQRVEKLVPSVAETTSAVLYFPFDSDSLTSTARAAIQELLKYIRQAGEKVVVSINGHADRAGGDNYNMALSEKRAKFVMETLKESGVPASQMEYFAFGETDPKVATGDGVAEPYNRRVEIFLE